MGPRISKQKANLRINSITSPKSDKKDHKNAKIEKRKLKKLLKAPKNLPKISKDQLMTKLDEVEIKIPKTIPQISKEQLMTKIKEVTSKTKAGKKVTNAKVRKASCKECDACVRPDCSQCNHCLDKPKFGGPNKMKQKCVERVCQNMSLYY